MKIINDQKHPLLLSIFLAVVTIVFMIFAGIIISVRGVNDVDAILVQGIFIWISAILGLLIMKISDVSMREYGLQLNGKIFSKKILWFLPIITVEACAFFAGMNDEVTMKIFIILVLFTIGVGINEEIYYRGLILKLLKIKGTKYAIIVSSIIFGLVHAFNALAGKAIIYIILQIIFAALFGFVCAEITILSKSLIIPIIWHAVHDLLALTTSQRLDTTALVILGVQSFVLIIYSVYLWKQVISESELNN